MKSTCEALPGKLVEMESPEENAFVSITVHSHGETASWIGLEDFAVDGRFVWTTTDEVPEYTNWYPGEPNGAISKEDCVVIFAPASHMQWNDDNCEIHEHPVSVNTRRTVFLLSDNGPDKGIAYWSDKRTSNNMICLPSPVWVLTIR